MPQTRPSGVHVRTPATSANLGPGFDALGLALGLYDEADVRLTGDDRLIVDVGGESAREVPLDASHLVVRAMRTVFEAAGEKLPGLHLRCTNRIPHGRGLGSSASAIVTGVSAATALLSGEDPALGRLDRDRVFRLAADIEGHPDNVAPCVYGGFTIAWRGDEGWGATGVAPSARVRPIVCVPEERLSTEQARGLLPDAVPHGDAAFTAGRAALLVAAVSGHPELLLEATEDRLHERYREPAMPESLRIARELREHDGLAAVVSGAGPTVLVLADAGDAAGGRSPRKAGDADQISDDLVDSIRRRTGKQWHIRPLAIDPAGAWIETPRS
ncbi:homoserine kinase [Streptomonospora litoralis]|uniref:Homoserine kinase n=1 Tax=Streptomonospora litoralis TaxID=2498135 RepID=A0A4P6PXC2_9ACTN|nr:homoserine kinase [Streptomonospora litoralis]QBI52848.1 Homoserine kinase [Streptomonospora litoralis]